jgi:nitrate reductase gamma subunit
MLEYLNTIFRKLIGSYVETTIDLLKIEAAIAYINGIKVTRRLFMVLCALVFCIVIIACGFLIIPIALCMFMPWSPETKAIVAIVFGAVYVLVPLITIVMLLSEKRWMKMTRSDELIRKVLKQ